MEGGPSRFRPGFTCPALLRCLSNQLSFSLTGLSPYVARLSRRILLKIADRIIGPTTPLIKSTVWALPISLAATLGISDLISFPLPT